MIRSFIKKPLALILSLTLAAAAAASPELSNAVFSEEAVTTAEAATSTQVFEGAMDTALYLREQLKTNTETITLNVKNTFNYERSKIFAFGDFVFDHLAKGYTGKADEGDILFLRQYTNLSYSYSTANNYITLTYTVAKNITASQQTAVKNAVAKIKSDLKLTKLASDYDRILAVHDWIVTNLTKQISYAMNKDILVGTNSGAFKGITGSVSASATALPATITKASLLKVMGSLGANYQKGAIWIMTSKMFYEDIMSITALNDYIINNGFDFRLFGHEVVLMEEALVSSKETIFYGDPKAYKVNIFKPIEIKPFETATTTNVQFRGACMADGELLDTSAFVRFAQT